MRRLNCFSNLKKPVKNARLFLSAILGFRIAHLPPCLLLQNLMGHFDVNARLDVFEIHYLHKSHNTVYLGGEGGGGVICIKTMDILFTGA